MYVCVNIVQGVYALYLYASSRELIKEYSFDQDCLRCWCIILDGKTKSTNLNKVWLWLGPNYGSNVTVYVLVNNVSSRRFSCSYCLQLSVQCDSTCQANCQGGDLYIMQCDSTCQANCQGGDLYIMQCDSTCNVTLHVKLTAKVGIYTSCNVTLHVRLAAKVGIYASCSEIQLSGSHKFL